MSSANTWLTVSPDAGLCETRYKIMRIVHKLNRHTDANILNWRKNAHTCTVIIARLSIFGLPTQSLSPHVESLENPGTRFITIDFSQ